MKTILSLDLGTNSVGYAVLEQEFDNSHGKTLTQIKISGVNTFESSVLTQDKGVSYISKAAERRAYRSARKLISRRRTRKIELLRILIRNKMCPLSIEELNKWKKDKNTYPKNADFRSWQGSGSNPYQLRTRALDEKITLHEFGRALYHITQRRGFSNSVDLNPDADLINEKIETFKAFLKRDILSINSNESSKALIDQFIIDNEDESDSTNKEFTSFKKKIQKLISGNDFLNLSNEVFKQKISFIIDEFKNKIEVSIDSINLEIIATGSRTIGEYFNYLYNKGEKVRGKYTGRSQYETEFYKICEKQNINKNLISELHDAIFFQRKLKSQKELVGKCRYEKSKSRIPVSHPNFEIYRTLSFVSNIRYKHEGSFMPLNKDQRDSLIPLFNKREDFKFSILKEKLQRTDPNIILNYADHTKISSNSTIFQLQRIFGTDWKNEIFNRYTDRKDKKIDDVINDVWHLFHDKSVTTESKKVFAIQKLQCTELEGIGFSTISTKNIYSALSLSAINKINFWLEKGYSKTTSVFLANIPALFANDNWKLYSTQIEKDITQIITKTEEGNIQNHASLINKFITHFIENYNCSHRNFIIDETPEFKEYIITALGNNDLANEICEKVEIQLRKKSPGGQYLKSDSIQNRISEYLQKNYHISKKKLELLYHPSIEDDVQLPKKGFDGKLYLPEIKSSNVKNPRVLSAVNCIKRIINQLIKEDYIDKNTIVQVETTRELNDFNRSAFYSRINRENEKKNDEARKYLENLFSEAGLIDRDVNEKDIEKYILFMEQDGICKYTGKQISPSEFYSNNSNFDIEHTLTKGFGNHQANKTLACKTFNRTIKKTLLPSQLSNYEEILLRIQPWLTNRNKFEKLFKNNLKSKSSYESKETKDKRIQNMHYYKHLFEYWKNKCDTFTLDQIPDNFKNNQLIDSAIINKFILKYLKSVFKNTSGRKGAITAQLRKIWEVENLKDRNNHYHHALDAVISGCATKNIYELAIELTNQHREYNDRNEAIRQEIKHLLPFECGIDGFNDLMKTQIENLTVVNHQINNKSKIAKKRKRSKGESKTPIFIRGDVARHAINKNSYYGQIIHPEKKEKILTTNLTLNKDIKIEDLKKVIHQGHKNEAISIINQYGAKELNNPEYWKNKNVPKKLKTEAHFTHENSTKLKPHRDISVNGDQKYINVASSGIYCAGLYEGVNAKGKIIRKFQLLSNHEAANTLKRSNNVSLQNYFPDFIDLNEHDLKFKTVLFTGLKVILYENSPDEIWTLSKSEKNQRFYVIDSIISGYKGAIELLRHDQTGNKNLKVKGMKCKYEPYLHSSANQLNALIENVDFKCSILGEIFGIQTESKLLLEINNV